MRFGALAMGPQVRHQRLEPRIGELLRVTEPDPVHFRAGKQAVEENDRPARTQSM
jgi:hypothetical protein